MPRVSQDTLNKLEAFINSLPSEARSKCALCNETLTHIVKQAEAQTGAGTATVTNAIASSINKDAASGDLVSGEALNQRVRRNEGLDHLKITNRKNKPEQKNSRTGKGEDALRKAHQRHKAAQDNRKATHSFAMDFAEVAISQLERITKKDPMGEEAYRKVINYIEGQRYSQDENPWEIAIRRLDDLYEWMNAHHCIPNDSKLGPREKIDFISALKYFIKIADIFKSELEKASDTK